MKAGSVWDAFVPLSTWSSYFGLWHIEKVQRGIYQKNRQHFVTPTLWLLFFVLLGLVALQDVHLDFSNVRSSVITQTLGSIYFSILLFTGVAFILIALLTTNRNIVALAEIDKIDHMITKAVPSEKDLVEANSKTCKISTALLAASVGKLITAVCIHLIGDIKVNQPQTALQLFPFAMSYLLLELMLVQFLTWATAIKKRFEIVNRSLQDMADASWKRDEEPNLNVLGVLRDVHVRLVQVARMVNGIYSFALFDNITLHFMIFVVHGYVGIYAITFLDDSRGDYLINSMKYLFHHGIEIYSTIYFSTELCLQVSTL